MTQKEKSNKQTNKTNFRFVLIQLNVCTMRLKPFLDSNSNSIKYYIVLRKIDKTFKLFTKQIPNFQKTILKKMENYKRFYEQNFQCHCAL